MFTGIIEAQGHIAALLPDNGDVTLRIQSAELDFGDVKLGDSIAVNGVCLTVTALSGGDSFSADVSGETLSLTSLKQLKAGSRVNLEKAMTPSTRMGGHLVSGHVDGLGTVRSLTRDARSVRIDIEAPAELARYIAQKGSITVDGISLTVNSVDGAVFSLNIIPHTQQVTTIQDWAVGTPVNLEVDIIARYLERLLLGERAAQAGSQGISMAFLAEHGFLNGV
ncbi:MAG: riboflavin synthase [Alcanivorax sp.]|uniref:Riboflavin synthase n=1 Tax=Alloalcanivorax marinus TaxID=1177169 RepID=A0A9Q3YKQ0_9GAMM|nr:riboflavin synthase [Alloalcanivorax marinus]MBM7334597.1 riboflavin synthase [Alloalcanivorax marinus]MCC4306989.1 riboflavin synthase [Alloalcanivorax marinus]MCU5786644.1 riboflavin synthase subunit alpha [Alloalcanivorax marinus]